MISFQITRPFGYLQIVHPTKLKVDFYVPAILSIILTLTIYFVQAEDRVWKEGGLIESLQGFIQGLPGFYIAALAVVATFGARSKMDVLIKNPQLSMKILHAGEIAIVGVTRRRFLSLLFSYLTALSIILTIFSSLSVSISDAVSKRFGSVLPEWSSDLIFFIFGFFLFQLVTVTFWGLYYLADRLHQPDPDEESNEIT